MSLSKEILKHDPYEITEPSRQERLNFEQVGLKELISNTEFMVAKRGGREPGVHKWGRI